MSNSCFSMVPMPMMAQPITFDRSFSFELDHAIKAAAIAAVSASKSSNAGSLLQPPPCSISSMQLPLFSGFSSQPRPILSKPLGMTDLPSIQKPGSNTAAIVSALFNSNRSVELMHMDSYGPLLQLAIRYAVSECISSLKTRVSLQGQLTISSESGEQVSVFFNDQQKAFPQARPPTLVHSPQQQQHQTPSKRKAYHPIRHFPVDTSPNSSSSSSSLINIPTSEYLSSQLSGSASPSTTDSGALDLSRAGSLNGSAPITPMKSLSVQDSLICHPFPILPQGNNLLEFYQNPFLMNMPFPDLHKPYQQQQLKSPLKNNRKRVCLPRETGASPIIRRSNATRKFPCNQCRDEFASLHSLEDHTISLHGTYRCHVCKAQFTQRSNLQRHALKHVGFKPFECRVCKKAYYRKDHLMRHMEMGHPGFSPRDNITVHLTSSESLDFLSRNPADLGEPKKALDCGFPFVKKEEETKNQEDTVLVLPDLKTSSIDENAHSIEKHLIEESKLEESSDEQMLEVVESAELQPSEEMNLEI